MHTNATPEALFGEVCALSGGRGWLVGTWLWALHGWLDRMVGVSACGEGVAIRLTCALATSTSGASKRSSLGVCCGFALRCRVPDDAWLEWPITPEPDGVLFVQRAVFRPRGLFGRVYWYSAAPFHRFVFGRLALGIEQHAAKALTGAVERAA